MGLARSVSVPVLIISWFLVAATNVAGSVVDESGSARPRVAVKHRAPR